MSGFTVTIDSSDLQAAANKVLQMKGAVEGDEVRMRMGFAIQETVIRHFIDLSQDAVHHQTAQSLGAERTGFYEEARAGTHDPQLEAGGFSISIEKAGLAQRYFGGTIEARPGSFLTIPAQAAAYGKSARDDFAGLLRLVIFGDTGLAALVLKDAPKADEGDVYFWLVRSVHQEGDPTVLPTEEEMTQAALDNAQVFFGETWGKN